MRGRIFATGKDGACALGSGKGSSTVKNLHHMHSPNGSSGHVDESGMLASAVWLLAGGNSDEHGKPEHERSPAGQFKPDRKWACLRFYGINLQSLLHPL